MLLFQTPGVVASSLLFVFATTLLLTAHLTSNAEKTFQVKIDALESKISEVRAQNEARIKGLEDKIVQEIQSAETQKLVINKQTTVGGSGGLAFNSGVNLSGVQKIHMCQGKIALNHVYYRKTIKRIYLEFEDPIHPGKRLNPLEDFDKCPLEDRMTFEVGETDSVTQIDVWSDGVLVNAIRLHTKLGSVSKIYGEPLCTSKWFVKCSSPISFKGINPDSKLVGVHGRAGDVIDKIGFTFADIVISENL